MLAKIGTFELSFLCLYLGLCHFLAMRSGDNDNDDDDDEYWLAGIEDKTK